MVHVWLSDYPQQFVVLLADIYSLIIFKQYNKEMAIVSHLESFTASDQGASCFIQATDISPKYDKTDQPMVEQLGYHTYTPTVHLGVLLKQPLRQP